MSRPVVLMDCDGPLLDFFNPAREVAMRVLGRTLPEVDTWTSWSVEESMGLDRAESAAVRAAFLLPSNRLAEMVRPWPNAVEGMDRLQQIADVVFVTACMDGHPTWSHVRRELLREIWPKVEVVQTAAKHRVLGDFLVDDRYETVAGGWKRNAPWKGVLWDMSYNQQCSYSPRVRGWDDLLMLVDTSRQQSAR